MTQATRIGAGISLGSGVRVGPSELVLSLDASNPASYDGTSGYWNDLSGRGNNTTLQGSTPWTSNDQTSYFTFNDGLATVDTILSNQAYTKIVVFRYSTSYYGNLISGDDANGHAFWGADTPYLNAGHNGAWYLVTSPVITPVNQWVFGAVTFNTTTGWRLYMNDNAVVTNGDTTPFDANPANLEVGGYSYANYLGGDIALAQVYNRVLNDSEIAQRYRFFQRRFGY
jgi:hypothetical protein